MKPRQRSRVSARVRARNRCMRGNAMASTPASTRRWTTWPVGLLIVLTLASCRADENSARGVADRFVNQEYVEINLDGAKPLCTGLALKKLEEQQRLTEGQQIDES